MQKYAKYMQNFYIIYVHFLTQIHLPQLFFGIKPKTQPALLLKNTKYGYVNLVTFNIAFSFFVG